MLELYAVQPTFYQTLKQHPFLLKKLVSLDKQQKEFIFQTMSYEEIYISACSYFQEHITMDHESLILKDVLNNRQYRMEFCQDFICIDNKENPFFKLLERKFHHYCIVISL